MILRLILHLVADNTHALPHANASFITRGRISFPANVRIMVYVHVFIPLGATSAEEDAEYSEVIDLESSLAAANVPDDAMDILQENDLMDLQVRGCFMFVNGQFLLICFLFYTCRISIARSSV